MQYLLDTNILIEFIHKNDTVANYIRKAGTENCFISVVSLEELYFGAYNAPFRYREQELEHIIALRKRFKVLPLPEDADDFGQMKADLVKRGLVIDDFDISIAATAKNKGMTVVTDNTKHFSRIENIKVVNWTNEE